MAVNITVRQSTVVKPSEPTPTMILKLSNLDNIFPRFMYGRVLLFYRYSGASDFFDSDVLKSSLANALVHFYPFAGRLKADENDNLEINCNGEGALFVEAESDAALEDLGDFSPRSDIPVIPTCDYSKGLQGSPLFLVQLTRFRCGGVCIGFAEDHHVADGTACLHFLNTWANFARGEGMAYQPFMDRQIALSPRRPPQPTFSHIEYHPPPMMKTPKDVASRSDVTAVMFKLTNEHVTALKAKCQADQDGAVKLTTFEVVAGHTWRCLTIVRQLPSDQESKLRIAVDGRPRIKPPLPEAYFGNVLFHATPIAPAGELTARSVGFSAAKIHESLAAMQTERLQSALDYLELESDRNAIARNVMHYDSPNASIISWVWLPLYTMDFGWGAPWFVAPGYGRGVDIPSGSCIVARAAGDDGGLVVFAAMAKEEVELFGKVFYDI